MRHSKCRHRGARPQKPHITHNLQSLSLSLTLLLPSRVPATLIIRATLRAALLNINLVFEGISRRCHPLQPFLSVRFLNFLGRCVSVLGQRGFTRRRNHLRTGILIAPLLRNHIIIWWRISLNILHSIASLMNYNPWRSLNPGYLL